MTALTARQQQLLAYISAYTLQHGYAPSIREIGAAAGIKSTNGVADALKLLESKGRIRRGINRARALAVVDQGKPHCPTCTCRSGR